MQAVIAALLCAMLASIPAQTFANVKQVLIEARIVTLQTEQRGDTTYAEEFLLNSAPIANTNSFQLSTNDEFQVIIRGSGRSGATAADPGELSGFVELTFDLAPDIDSASFLFNLTTTAAATGADAFAVGGFFFTCSPGSWSCIAESGNLPEQYGKELTVDTVFGNGTQEYDSGIPDTFMPNGRFGGMETLNFEENFTIDQALAPEGSPRRFSASLTYNFGALESTADITHTLSITMVPIPAALPLFGSALAGLGLIGWRRRS